MNLEDLMDLVDEELSKPIRRDLCDWEASRIPALHAKYRKILVFEKLELERMKAGLLPLIKKKRRLYKTGAIDKDEEKREGQFNERPDPKLKVPVAVNPSSKAKDNRVIADELTFWVDADVDIINARELITIQNEKVEYLKDTLDELRKRSYLISNIINTQRFKAGLDKLNVNFDFLEEPED